MITNPGKLYPSVSDIFWKRIMPKQNIFNKFSRPLKIMWQKIAWTMADISGLLRGDELTFLTILTTFHLVLNFYHTIYNGYKTTVIFRTEEVTLLIIIGVS
jgi:hypothetical protein